jgi:hypothetical protein
MNPAPAKALVGIFAWPPGVSDDAKANAIVATLGVDRYEAALMVKRGFPQIVGALPEAEAGAVTARLQRAQIDATMAGPEDLAAHARPDLARRLHAGQDDDGPTYLAELWSGVTRIVRLADFVLIVRARLKATTVTETRRASIGRMSVPIGGMHMPAAPSEPRTTKTTKVSVSEIMDLHFEGDRPLRLHGDKFSFDVLDQRGITDAENMDLLALRLAEEAPACSVDIDYSSFRPSKEVVRMFDQATGRRGDPRVSVPAEFDLYSAWTAVRQFALRG